MRERNRSRKSQAMADDQRSASPARATGESAHGLARHQMFRRAAPLIESGEYEAAEHEAVDVQVTDVVERDVESYEVILPDTATEDPTQLVGCSQVTLNANQLARLWLREPTLTAGNVFVWSSERNQWIPALAIPEVSVEITKARVDSIRTLSKLSAARSNKPIPPPRNTRAIHRRPPHDPIAAIGFVQAPPLAPVNSLAPTALQATPTIGASLPWLRGLITSVGNAAMSAVAGSNLGLHFIAAVCSKYVHQPNPLPRMRGALWPVVAGWLVVGLVLPYGAFRISRNRANRSPIGKQFAEWKVNIGTMAPAVTPVPMAGDELPPVANPTSQADHSTQPPRANANEDARDVSVAHGDSKPRQHAKLGEFDASMAKRAVNRAANRVARECLNGEAHGNVAVTFLPSGHVRNVQFGKFTGNSVQRNCATAVLLGMKVAPFAGAPVTAHKRLHLFAKPLR